MDVLKEHGFDPARCVLDHNNEKTVQAVLDRGRNSPLADEARSVLPD
jgi:predicted metal-dependent TIM-barrel fold hydrolase